MKLSINILKDNIIYSFSFLNSSSNRIYMENEFIIDCFKSHNHKYYYRAFLYNSKRIISYRYFRSKKEMYFDVQNLLKEELYNVIQYC